MWDAMTEFITARYGIKMLWWEAALAGMGC